MSKLSREITGRCAIAVMGLALLWGGYKCLRVGWAIQDDFNQRDTGPYPSRRSSGSGLPIGIGIVLVLFGAPLTIAAMVPVRVFEKMMGRVNNVTLWENPEASNHLRGWNDLL